MLLSTNTFKKNIFKNIFKTALFKNSINNHDFSSFVKEEKKAQPRCILGKLHTYSSSIKLGTDHLTWRGGLWFFVSLRNFISDNTRVLILFFFVELNIRLYDKNSESDYFFFPPPKSEYIFQQHWESEYFFKRKTIPPPFKLNGRSLTINLNGLVQL